MERQAGRCWREGEETRELFDDLVTRGRAVKSTAVSQDGPIPSAARPELSKPRRCLDEPLSPLVLSHFQLVCRS
jgi:hypothetical protein